MPTTVFQPALSPPSRSPRRVFALLGVSLGYFMVLLDVTVLSVAEPDLARSLHASVGGLQWVVNGYTVAFAALLLSAGAVADRYGAQRVFRVGVGAFAALSLVSAAAPNLGTLVAARVALGVAGAACLPASMALVVRLYPDPADRVRAMAVWAATSGAALAAGPVVGGVLVDLAGWRAIFLVDVPIAVVVLALVNTAALRGPTGDRPIDVTAQVVACAVLALLTDALIALGAGARAHAVASGVGCVAAGALLVVVERRSDAPALAPHVLRVRGATGAMLSGAAVNFTLTGALFVLPLVLTRQWHLSPTRVGLAFLPLTLPCAFNPLLTGRIVARAGAARPVLAGLALLSSGAVVLGLATLRDAPYAVLAVGLALTGFGVSCTLPALAATVVAAAPEGSAGTAGGLLNASRQVGATVGVAVMGALIAHGG
ncbi:MFS transporter, partial [Streptomyces sp. SID3343]|uniref:MFS transporter n=1 Tax=Streptomyces sp. SID3343 TaxID=2690260 RepID=UPI0031F98F87